MPDIELVDLKNTVSKKFSLISDKLEMALKKVLSKKEQAILLLNRRGYSNFVFCPSCKHSLECKNCDVTLTFHKSGRATNDDIKTVHGKHLNFGIAVCHYCQGKTLVPKKCPLCNSNMTMIGLGAQRLEEELNSKFPNSKIARIDSDSMQSKDYYSLLNDFADGKIDILAGTQMLAKGLHFPNVTLVGVVSADTSLAIPDFRANERTFQLLSQVAGRTGRSEKKGFVIVQTFMPDQPAIRYASRNDYEGFIAEELSHRTKCSLPPAARLALITLRDTKFERLDTAANKMRELLDNIIASHDLKVHLRGPFEPAIARIHQFHRLQIIVQSPDAANIQSLFSILRSMPSPKPAVDYYIDVDPINLL